MKSQIQFLQLLIIAVLFVFNSTSLSHAKPQDKNRWNKKYDIEIYLFGEKPIPFLVDNIEILRKGKALDVAMGEGRNGVYLATHVWQDKPRFFLLPLQHQVLFPYEEFRYYRPRMEWVFLQRDKFLCHIFYSNGFYLEVWREKVMWN